MRVLRLRRREGSVRAQAAGVCRIKKVDLKKCSSGKSSFEFIELNEAKQKTAKHKKMWLFCVSLRKR